MGGMDLGDLEWDGRFLRLDDEQLGVLRRPHLSVSAANGFGECPARYAGERILPDEEGLMLATTLGNDVHDIFEALFNRPYDKRTKRDARDLLRASELAKARERFPEAESDQAALAAFWEVMGVEQDLTRHVWLAALWRRAIGLWSIEDPSRVMVRATEWKLDGTLLGGQMFKGYIDRVDIVGDERTVGVSVADYKTGRPWIPRPGDPPDAKDLQLLLYGAAIAKHDGRLPLHSWLYYTMNGGVKRYVAMRQTDVDDAVNWFADKGRQVNAALDAERFEATRQKFCNWCSLRSVCPTFEAEPNWRAPRRKAAATPAAEPVKVKTPRPRWLADDLAASF